MTRNIFLLLIGLVLGLSSCRQDSEVFIPDPSPDIGKSSIAGQVIAEDGTPLSGVDIYAGTRLVQTDDQGVFKIDDVRTEDSKLVVRAQKSGYFHASRLHYATDDALNFIRIMMLEQTEQARFNAATGASLTLTGDVRLEFSPGSIVDASGADYSGEVSVRMAYLDPLDDNFSKKMPGNLLGQGTDLEEVGLTSYGMLAVDLMDDGGSLLQIKDGSQAQVDAPVPNGFNAGTASIPLWSYDEAAGLWKEEGSASIQSGRMIGSLGHFSWWNFDLKTEMVMICMSLEYDMGMPATPIPAALVSGCICRDAGLDGKLKTCGVTDENGMFKARVPVNEVLELKIQDPCGAVIFTTQLGPYTTDGIEPTILIPASSLSTSIITGTLADCNGAAVANGYMVYTPEGGDDQIGFVENGVISDTILVCTSDSIRIYGVDVDNILKTESKKYETADAIDVGIISSCDQLDEFISLEYGVPGNYTERLWVTDFEQLYDGVVTVISVRDSMINREVQIEMRFSGMDGSDAGFSYLTLYSVLDGDEIFCASVPSTQELDFTILEYGAVGEAIRGTFTGSMCSLSTPSDSSLVDVNGQFRITRRQ